MINLSSQESFTLKQMARVVVQNMEQSRNSALTNEDAGTTFVESNNYYAGMTTDSQNVVEELFNNIHKIDQSANLLMTDSLVSPADKIMIERSLAKSSFFKQELNKLIKFRDDISRGVITDDASLADLGELGHSVTSGIVTIDPTYFTSGLHKNRFIEVYGDLITGAMSFTSEVIKTYMYSIYGGFGFFNWDAGVVDSDNIDQEVTYSNYRSTRVGITFKQTHVWQNMLREAQGIPYLAPAYLSYFMQKAIDSIVAEGCIGTDKRGILNVPKVTVDFSGFAGTYLGTGNWECTQLYNLFAGLYASLITVDGEYNYVLGKMYIPQNLYNYLKLFKFALISDGTNGFSGSVRSDETLLEALRRNFNLDIVVAPVMQTNIIVTRTTDIQNYQPIQWYKSGEMSATLPNIAQAPANIITESAVNISEAIVRQKTNVIEIIMPDKINANIVRKPIRYAA